MPLRRLGRLDHAHLRLNLLSCLRVGLLQHRIVVWNRIGLHLHLWCVSVVHTLGLAIDVRVAGGGLGDRPDGSSPLIDRVSHHGLVRLNGLGGGHDHVDQRADEGQGTEIECGMRLHGQSQQTQGGYASSCGTAKV